MIIRSNGPYPHYTSWTEIDLKAVRFNFEQISKLNLRNRFSLPTRQKIISAPMGILLVIKADAYGHGMMRIAKLLDQSDLVYWGVSDVSEAIILRKSGIKKPILLFESTLLSDIPSIIEWNLTPTICTLEFARRLNQLAQKKNKKIKVHVEVDTGMGRLGIWHKDAFDFIKRLNDFRSLVIEGIFTHFPAADSDRKFTQKQIQELTELVIRLDKTGLIIPLVHAANSMGLAGYKTTVLNLVRPGLMMYGLYPDEKLKRNFKLKPVMSVKSKVIFVKRIEKGRSISYNRTFIAKKSMTVATIPIGYNDGYLRGFSNNAIVLINGVYCPIIGVVTMDQIIVDVTKVKNIRVGSEVTLLGKEGAKEISAQQLAQFACTINYEIVCHLGNRLPRVFKK